MHPLEGFMCAKEHFQARLDDVLLILAPKPAGSHGSKPLFLPS